MISVIIPFYNEAENLPILVDKLTRILTKQKNTWEIILADDASTDNSTKSIAHYMNGIYKDKIKLISHRKRFGKGKALLTGFQQSKGDIIIFMDADLQNDPLDLPLFMEKVNQGFELVNGWRKERKDGLVKTIPSRIGNHIILKYILRSKFHDINCGFKLMKRKVLEEIPLYGDNFRLLPVMAEKHGFKTTEIVVKHNPRFHGKSKYGFFRRFSIFADILTAYFIFRFSEKPLHFFGIVGLPLFLLGTLILLILGIERIIYNQLLYRRPMLFVGILLIIVGIQISMTGIIAELLVYLNKKNK